MPPSDWEFEYNGLTFGGATNYGLAEIDGLSPPDSRSDIIEKPSADGATVFAKYLDPRTLTFSGDIRSDGSDFEAQVTAWRQAFVPQEDALPLKFLIPGDGDEVKRINCVPVKRDFKIDPFYSIEYALWSVQFVAGDPLIYSDTLKTLTITPGSGGGEGIDFDVDFDLNFGGGSSISGAAVNDGIVATALVATITGPATNPKVQNDNAEGGLKFLKFNITLGSGDVLDIDFAARTVTLNGTASRYNTLDQTSEWWKLSPGSSTIQFIVSGATGATQLDLEWRDAWI